MVECIMSSVENWFQFLKNQECSYEPVYLYQKEIAIGIFIRHWTLTDLPYEDKISLLQKTNLIENFSTNHTNGISFETSFGTITLKLLSDVYTEFSDAGFEKKRTGVCMYASPIVSKTINFDNYVIVGHTYPFQQYVTNAHVWVEYKDDNGKEWVIDYTWNVIINKTGYYALTKASPIFKFNRSDVSVYVEDGIELTPETLTKFRETYYTT